MTISIYFGTNRLMSECLESFHHSESPRLIPRLPFIAFHFVNATGVVSSVPNISHFSFLISHFVPSSHPSHIKHISDSRLFPVLKLFFFIYFRPFFHSVLLVPSSLPILRIFSLFLDLFRSLKVLCSLSSSISAFRASSILHKTRRHAIKKVQNQK